MGSAIRVVNSCFYLVIPEFRYTLPGEMVRIGDTVTVKVLSFDKDNEKISTHVKFFPCFHFSIQLTTDMYRC